MNNIMDFTLEDVANYIAWNDCGTRKGFGIPEINNLASEVVEKLGLDEEDSDVQWRIINESINKAFVLGMKAMAQLQAQLLMGGAANG